jgi:hypothetical protein
MRSILQNVFLASAIASTALATNAAMAATRLDVPFTFTAAGKTLPAGSYTVKRDSSGGFVTLESADASQSFTWLLTPGKPKPTDEKIVLRFDDGTSTRVLQSIQFGSMITPRLDKGKNERMISERDSRGQ